jgi:hypothetical protein
METFDIDINSSKLKSLVGQYDSDFFISAITELLTFIDAPMEIYPFQPLDSPLKQFTYLASLNLSSNISQISKNEEPSEEDWKEIVKYTVKVKAGYLDLLLPKANDDKSEYYEFYKVAMPVFLNYFDAGALNFEEQEIERIQRLFTPFDNEISTAFGLTTKNFLDIYELIDNALFENLNKPSQLLKNDVECKQFADEQRSKNVAPQDWNYEGENDNVKEFIKHFSNKSEKFTIQKENLKSIDKGKIDLFFELFTIQRVQTEYLYYTQANPVLAKPIYQLHDGRYLIISIKQVIHAIHNLLQEFVSNKENKLVVKFNPHKGKYLQEKVCEIFNNFFNGQAHIHNEYKTEINGDGQDVLILYKGLCLIIEVKNKKAAIPHSYPKDVPKLFDTIYRYFKNAIQEGYEQCWRVKKLFDKKIDFKIFDEKNQIKHSVRTKNYHNVFSIIVTEEDFRKPQIDLSHLLILEKDDENFPFSVSIDNLEIILLTLRKLKRGVGDLIHFLKLREELQGRLDCNDELQLWGAFINNKKFSVPKDENFHFRTFPPMADFYDELYKTGLGFKNEKNIDKKKSDKWNKDSPLDILKKMNPE